MKWSLSPSPPAPPSSPPRPNFWNDTYSTQRIVFHFLCFVSLFGRMAMLIDNDGGDGDVIDYLVDDDD